MKLIRCCDSYMEKLRVGLNQSYSPPLWLLPVPPFVEAFEGMGCQQWFFEGETLTAKGSLSLQNEGNPHCGNPHCAMPRSRKNVFT